MLLTYNNPIFTFHGAHPAQIFLDLTEIPRVYSADSTFLAAVSRADCTRFALRSRVDLVEAVAALLGFEYSRETFALAVRLTRKLRPRGVSPRRRVSQSAVPRASGEATDGEKALNSEIA